VGKYEQTYGTDWGTLTVDQAMTRAYALGVAASLGEYHPDELEAIRNEMGSAYERSVVDLAFEEGEKRGPGTRRGEQRRGANLERTGRRRTSYDRAGRDPDGWPDRTPRGSRPYGGT
jgi:hypothetical protein